MLQIVLAYNFVLLGCDLFAVFVYSRFRTLTVLMACSAMWFLVATGLALYLGQITFSGVLLLSYGVFLHGPINCLLCSGLAYHRSRPTALLLGTAALALIGIAIDAFLVEPEWLEISHVRIESPKVTRPHRLCLVADLQTDRLGAYERKAFAAIANEHPDLVVMAGDYLQAPTTDEPSLLRAFNKFLCEIDFSAPLGVYAVGGNTDSPGWQMLFAGTRVTTIPETARRYAGELTITGLSVPDSFNRDLEIPADERFQVVVGHAPDFALGEIDAELLLAGHTHGGQVQLPGFGPVLTLSQVPRAWASGATRLAADRLLYVSRGVGMERGTAPRLRFLCRPQLVIFDIVPSLRP